MTRNSSTWEIKLRSGLKPNELLYLTRLADAHEALDTARARLRNFQPSEFTSDRYGAAVARYQHAHRDIRVIQRSKPS